MLCRAFINVFSVFCCMVLDALGDSLKKTLKKIAGALFVNERLIDELVKDIQRALLQADVQVQLVFELTKKIKERALHEKPPTGVSQREHLITIVYEELVKFFGEKRKGIEVGKKKPFVVMLVGLFGSGKSTTAGKIARYYSTRGFKIATVGLDVHRPAAPTQLKMVSDQVHVDCFIDTKEKNPINIWKNVASRVKGYDLVIVDTAGRDALSKDLVKEIEDVSALIKADEKLLVISADIGQAARAQAEQFHKSCGITGVIVTKMDGTARGGGSLSACAATGAPIVFVGVGEKMDDLESFHPEGFVGRLLGMGDLESLLEKAKDALDVQRAGDMSERLMKGEFNFLDLYEQLSAMRKMGPLTKVMEMIPGLGGFKIPKEMLEVQEGKLEVWKHILNSMTQEELEQPDILDRGRIERIAKGSGCSVKDVRELLKQYHQSRKLIKMMKGKSPEKLMKTFGRVKMK